MESKAESARASAIYAITSRNIDKADIRGVERFYSLSEDLVEYVQMLIRANKINPNHPEDEISIGYLDEINRIDRMLKTFKEKELCYGVTVIKFASKDGYSTNLTRDMVDEARHNLVLLLSKMTYAEIAYDHGLTREEFQYCTWVREESHTALINVTKYHTFVTFAEEFNALNVIINKLNK